MIATTTNRPSIETTPQQRTAARLAAGCSHGDNFPSVQVIAGGGLPPHLLGESYYHTTPSGKTRVYHPSAYGWPTWYHASTRRVVVGEHWLREHATA